MVGKIILVPFLCLTVGFANGEEYEPSDRPLSELFSSKSQTSDSGLGVANIGVPPSYNSSPLNYENSELNYDNSPLNYKNSPLNYENSPMRYGNERIIRDNEGNPLGYEVPKAGGGANYFDFNGKRLGYKPAD